MRTRSHECVFVASAFGLVIHSGCLIVRSAVGLLCRLKQVLARGFNKFIPSLNEQTDNLRAENNGFRTPSKGSAFLYVPSILGKIEHATHFKKWNLG